MRRTQSTGRILRTLQSASWLVLLTAGCHPPALVPGTSLVDPQSPVRSIPTAPTVPAASRLSLPVQKVLDDCRRQTQVTTGYDPAYTTLRYPGGDVAPQTGVCADVIVRGFRAVGIDLQKQVHEDMQAHFAAYPKLWGLRRPDPNIDHRRVANLMTYFKRQGWTRNPNTRAADADVDCLPGDIICWRLPGNHLHIGMVTDRREGEKDGLRHVPLVVHNVGAGAREEDVLLAWPIIGHYRPLFVTKGENR